METRLYIYVRRKYNSACTSNNAIHRLNLVMPNVVQDFVEISIDNIYKFHPSSLQAVFLFFPLISLPIYSYHFHKSRLKFKILYFPLKGCIK